MPTGTLQDYALAVESVISDCRDSEQGFRAAADAEKESTLREMYQQLSVERGRFAAEVQEAIKKMGFDPTNPAGLGGVLHGGWMSLKSAISKNSDLAILVETQRGEEWLLKTYRSALERNLPDEIRSILERQKDLVQHGFDRIRVLRENREPKPASFPA